MPICRAGRMHQKVRSVSGCRSFSPWGENLPKRIFALCPPEPERGTSSARSTHRQFEARCAPGGVAVRWAVHGGAGPSPRGSGFGHAGGVREIVPFHLNCFG